jgi:cation transporter-like permease
MMNRIKRVCGHAHLWAVFFGQLGAYLMQLFALLLVAAGMGSVINGINQLARMHDGLMAMAPVLFEAPIVIVAIVLFGYELSLSIRSFCRGFDKIMEVRGKVTK